MKIKTFDLTGFGGGYEATTQKMLWNGVRFVQGKNLQPVYLESKNLIGVAIAEGNEAEDLDKAIMEGIDDATGAMHQCAVGHIRYINKNGYAKWFKMMSEARKEEGSTEYDYEHDFELTQ